MRWYSRRSARRRFLRQDPADELCLLIVALSALVCAVATSFSFLVAMRVAAGLVAGGVFPIGMALIGDLVPVNQRQVAIARLLAVGLTGNLLGATLAGVIGDLLGWRGVFGILGLFGLTDDHGVLRLPRVVTPPPAPFHRAAIVANFRSIFADPRAKICFGAVFLEAIFIHGLFPFVALLLLGTGETKASVAGLLIAAFAVGGVAYSFMIPFLIGRVPERRLMIIGGAVAASGLIPWRCTFPGIGRWRSTSASGSASISCTAAFRCMSPSCRRPRAAPRRHCIPASSISVRRSAR